MYLLVGAIIGLLLGAPIIALLLFTRHARTQTDLTHARTRASLLEEQMQQQLEEIKQLTAELADIDRQREDARRDATALSEQLKARQQQFEEQKALLADAKSQLGDAFAALGAKALQVNSEEFLKLAATAFEKLMTQAKGDVEKRRQAIDALVKPIRELLEKQNQAVGEIEKKREVAYRGLEEQIKGIATAHEKLNTETGRLVTALRRPEQRGRWGEMQLRNVVELSGMTEHCDFQTQVQTDDPNTRDRPDMTVHVPGEGVIIVDAKVALDAYLDAIQPDGDRESALRRHAEQVEKHVKKLAAKQYWDQFQRTPKLVVMFMPLESALVAALEVRPHLHAEAMQNHVLIATPTLLVALLRAVAYGWQQEDVAANARKISETGRELYERLAKFTDHFAKVGAGIDRAARSYNQAIGSLETRVLPSTRRLKDLHATTQPELQTPQPIEIETRPVTAGELTASPDSPA